MNYIPFPVIDPVKTGENIQKLRMRRQYSVKDLQTFFGFDSPQAIYKWQKGQSLPSVDHLFALSGLFGIPMDQILVGGRPADSGMQAGPDTIFHNKTNEQVPEAPALPFLSFFHIAGSQFPDTVLIPDIPSLISHHRQHARLR